MAWAHLKIKTILENAVWEFRIWDVIWEINACALSKTNVNESEFEPILFERNKLIEFVAGRWPQTLGPKPWAFGVCVVTFAHERSFAIRSFTCHPPP